ncbi:hypothetical protein MESS2_1570021 [Mesorhizobium metallidurans STM 2683]|uniref:Uncharacterized protein n=1 Tax=Mesorhizobium metallidurans STM 2683 TaxID=1297569 RepID=M5F0S6_9HYPH|nr:hypothetical protein MESS2_1570021 [Mesorhizobium metallidurans STM 2683]
MRPLGRTKYALTLAIVASCFPKIESDFRADAIANVKAAATFEIDKRAGICREWMPFRPIGTGGASC